MVNFILKCFIKDYKNVNDKLVRESYSVLSGIVGIVCNIILFVAKFVIGTVTKSVSITTDSFNNLSDVGSSVVVVLGAKFGNRPADKEHPFGHGRVEYISSLIISFIILFVGVQFLKESIQKIFHPEPLIPNVIAIIILMGSVLVKVWLSYFNRKLGKAIKSSALVATSLDSLSDVLATTATIISILVYQFLHINVDGFVGCIVAGFVIFAGYNIAKETLSLLIGQSTDYEMAENIKKLMLQYENILGVHDLIVHNYGPGKSMASIHAEVPDNLNIHTLHQIIDLAEREIAEKLNIEMVIHMDPIAINNEQLKIWGVMIDEIIKNIDQKIAKHDFRMVKGEKGASLIFDIEVPHQYDLKRQKEILEKIKGEVKKRDDTLNCIINVDKSFIADK